MFPLDEGLPSLVATTVNSSISSQPSPTDNTIFFAFLAFIILPVISIPSSPFFPGLRIAKTCPFSTPLTAPIAL